jgi:hypothetical protein
MTDLFESLEGAVNNIKANMATLMEVIGELVTENTRLRVQSEELDEELANLSTYSTSKGTAQLKKELKGLRAENAVLREQQQQQQPGSANEDEDDDDSQEEREREKDEEDVLKGKLFVSLTSGEYYYEPSTRKLYVVGDSGTPGEVVGTMNMIELKHKAGKKAGKYYCDPSDDHVYAGFDTDHQQQDGLPFDASGPVGVLNKTREGKTKLRFLTDESIYSRK